MLLYISFIVSDHTQPVYMHGVYLSEAMGQAYL